MPEPDGRRFPSWAEAEWGSDLAWISENLHLFWPVAHQGHEENGRGAIVVDTTQRPTGEGYPFGHFKQAIVAQTGDDDSQRMVRDCDPSWEMVTVVLKTHDPTSTYRVGVVRRMPRE